MRIIWLPASIEDLNNIEEYIRKENPKAADEVSRKIDKTTSYLKDYPNLGKPYMFDNFRKIKVSSLPFIVLYRVKDRKIIIARIFYVRQNSNE